MGMLTNVFKNLFSKPATLRYPFEKREPVKKYRGKIEWDKEKCIYCGLCAKACPAVAIHVVKDKENEANNKWEWNPLRCIGCGECVAICPKDALSQSEIYNAPVYDKPEWRH